VNKNKDEKFLLYFIQITLSQEGEDKTVEQVTHTFPLSKFFNLNPKVVAEEPSFYTATYSKNREEQ
jgi:hypothetical protein